MFDITFQYNDGGEFPLQEGDISWLEGQGKIIFKDNNAEEQPTLTVIGNINRVKYSYVDSGGKKKYYVNGRDINGLAKELEKRNGNSNKGIVNSIKGVGKSLVNLI